MQFHPESIGTNEGKKILSNFMNIASQMRRHIPSDQDHMPTVTHDTRQSYITPSSLVHTSSKTPVKESSSSISIENKKKGVRNVFVTSRSFSSLVKPVSVSGNSIHNNEDDLIEQLFSTLFSKSNASFWLDNPSYRQQTISPTSSMVSYLGSADSEGGCVLEYEGGERLQQRLSDGTTSQLNQTIFEYIHEGIEEQKNEWDIIAHMIDPSSDIPVDVLNSAVADVAKGRVLFGYLGYEARHEAVALLTQTSASHTPTSHVTNKHHTENSNTDSEISAPKSVFFLPARYIAVDHARQILHVISLQDEVSKDKVAKHEDSKNSSNIHSTFVEKVDQVLNSFSQRSSTAPHSVCATLQPVPESIQGTLYSTFSKQQYSDKIRQCLEHISDGESYELCLTMKFLGKRSTLSSDTGSSVNDDGMDFSTYKRLRRRNPAPYSSFIKYKSMNANAVGKSYDFSVGCSSPERYLKLTKEGVIESKPIKGTAKRDLTDLVRDQQIVSTLAQNEKCRAENLMIVDLVRNDLGRVCEVGSVITSKLMEVETYTSVHQMVSTIRGQLCANMNVADALVATFPGGSMTGAPKLRTMELIDQLEEHQPRGIYSGTIGYIALDGSADLNIVIRTAIISGDQITVGAGGAIVAQSDPEMVSLSHPI